MSEKWTKEEFLAKIQWEGFDYAFNGYGLNVAKVAGAPAELVKSQEAYVNARNHFQDFLCDFLGVQDLEDDL